MLCWFCLTSTWNFIILLFIWMYFFSSLLYLNSWYSHIAQNSKYSHGCSDRTCSYSGAALRYPLPKSFDKKTTVAELFLSARHCPESFMSVASVIPQHNLSVGNCFSPFHRWGNRLCAKSSLPWYSPGIGSRILGGYQNP